MTDISDYDFITQKIDSFQSSHLSALKDKKRDYSFTALCVRSSFYKNPNFVFGDDDIQQTIVDGTGDGGVDAILADPSSDTNDLILVQSKFYGTISMEQVQNAINKMIAFYKDMENGDYQNFNQKTQKRYLSLNADRG